MFISTMCIVYKTVSLYFCVVFHVFLVPYDCHGFRAFKCFFWTQESLWANVAVIIKVVVLVNHNVGGTETLGVDCVV